MKDYLAAIRWARALILRQGVALMTAGSRLGLACALALGRCLEGLLFEVPSNDPATLVVVLAAVGLLTCLLPGRCERVAPTRFRR